MLETASGKEDRFYALPDAAKASFEVGHADEARRFAEELLELAPEFRANWNYGNAMHDGHMVLGRIALATGEIEAAKEELLRAGETPGSPQLNTFGPNMSLAKELLEQGENETVVDYFDRCAIFWTGGEEQLRRWKSRTKAGEVPVLGANLLY